MYQYMQFLTKKWRQQGAIIAFTALLLPMIIVGVGLAVDLGNIYVQYSRLQNAADAAALAGAKAYAENNETVYKHSNADAKAEKYIQGEFHNLNDKQKEQIKDNYQNGKNDDRYKARIKDNVTYYRVKLYKEVPLYFLGGIYKTISGKETYTVPVESVAAISSASQPGTPSNSAFPNLFTFSDSFTAINNVQNPDNANVSELSSTYTGRIVYTKKTATRTYRHELITNEARETNYTVSEAIKDGRYVNTPLLEEDDIFFYKETAEALGNSVSSKFTQNDQNITVKNNFNSFYISTNDKGKSIIHYTHENGVDITFDTNVIGNKNDPLYIIIDKAQNPKIHINSNIKITRPIVYCYLGTNELWIYGSDNAEFHGIIYAPNTQISVSNDNWKFYGSMVGKSISLKDKVDYTYEDFGISNNSGSGSSSSGSNTHATNNPQVKLVSPKSINWD